MKVACDARHVTLVVAILPRRDQVSGLHAGRAYNTRASLFLRHSASRRSTCSKIFRPPTA